MVEIAQPYSTFRLYFRRIPTSRSGWQGWRKGSSPNEEGGWLWSRMKDQSVQRKQGAVLWILLAWESRDQLKTILDNGEISHGVIRLDFSQGFSNIGVTWNSRWGWNRQGETDIQYLESPTTMQHLRIDQNICKALLKRWVQISDYLEIRCDSYLSFRNYTFKNFFKGDNHRSIR